MEADLCSSDKMICSTDYSTLLSQINFVGQEPTLVAVTIKDNTVTFSAPPSDCLLITMTNQRFPRFYQGAVDFYYNEASAEFIIQERISSGKCLHIVRVLRYPIIKPTIRV